METVLRHGFRLARQPDPPVPAALAYADAALAASAAPMQGLMALRDLRFGGAPWQSFDLFGPHPDGTARPVLVFLHGGGWVSGHKEWCGFLAPGAAAAGALLAAPTHRLAPEHRLPTQLGDLIAALRAIRERVGPFGGDPDRLLLAGHSAGGHLVSLAALRPEALSAGGVDPGAIRGLLPVSAILDLVHPDPAPGSLEAMVYSTVLADPAEDAASSPLRLADRLRVPLHLSWGASDTPRVLRSNPAMAEALRGTPWLRGAEAGAGLDHFGTHLALRDPSHPWFGALRRMIEETPA
ncbi:alpha/beta hydrolase fold domain-containing protein [Roseomonas sp. OT10]|uniref:alpha/beta hydrolase n=1 Tax=Roseomonas cutis TaxID=2897332 RepID=UPI001E3AE6D4|nr:alpha/beta hydrolase [Roseomonas sp. OT10]UFN49684.1 alpha/beta hydrolase fold domain-containing protein [Roseomonas sp. OT10]